MIYLKLYLMFFKIGVIAFGGLEMLSLLEVELVTKGWMTQAEFFNLLSISQMTPGAVGINAAVYTGNFMGGVLGGLIALIGVSTPSLLAMTTLISFVKKFKHSPHLKSFFAWLRPIIIGLIVSIIFKISRSTIITKDLKIIPATLLITITGLVLLRKFKVEPIKIIVISGVLGFMLL